MSENKHTPEPWVLNTGRNVFFDRVVAEINASEWTALAGVVVVNGGREDEEGKANARRIVACVNACTGISTDDLERYYNAGGGIDEAMNEAGLRDHIRVIQQRDNLRPQAEALHKVAAALGFEAGTDVTIAPIAVKNLAASFNRLDQAHQDLLAERDDWRTYAREAGAQKVQACIELREVKQQNEELLKALESMVQIARLTIGWACTPANADGPLVVAEQLIARVKGGAA